MSFEKVGDDVCAHAGTATNNSTPDNIHGLQRRMPASCVDRLSVENPGP